jgi:hypothetical protein
MEVPANGQRRWLDLSFKIGANGTDWYGPESRGHQGGPGKAAKKKKIEENKAKRGAKNMGFKKRGRKKKPERISDKLIRRHINGMYALLCSGEYRPSNIVDDWENEGQHLGGREELATVENYLNSDGVPGELIWGAWAAYAPTNKRRHLDFGIPVLLRIFRGALSRYKKSVPLNHALVEMTMKLNKMGTMATPIRALRQPVKETPFAKILTVEEMVTIGFVSKSSADALERDHGDDPDYDDRFLCVNADPKVVEAIVESGVSSNPRRMTLLAQILEFGSYMMGGLFPSHFDLEYEYYDREAPESFDEFRGMLETIEVDKGETKWPIEFATEDTERTVMASEEIDRLFSTAMEEGMNDMKDIIMSFSEEAWDQHDNLQDSSAHLIYRKEAWRMLARALYDERVGSGRAQDIIGDTDGSHRRIDLSQDAPQTGEDPFQMVAWNCFGKPKSYWLPYLANRLRELHETSQLIAQGVYNSAVQYIEETDAELIKRGAQEVRAILETRYGSGATPKDWLLFSTQARWFYNLGVKAQPSISCIRDPLANGSIMLNIGIQDGPLVTQGYEHTWAVAAMRMFAEESIVSVHPHEDGPACPCCTNSIGPPSPIGELPEVFSQSPANKMYYLPQMQDAINFKIDYDTQRIILLQKERKSRIPPTFLQLPFPSMFIETRLAMPDNSIMEGMFVHELVVPDDRGSQEILFYNPVSCEMRWVHPSDAERLLRDEPLFQLFTENNQFADTMDKIYQPGNRIWVMKCVLMDQTGIRRECIYTWEPQTEEDEHQRFPHKKGSMPERMGRAAIDLLAGMVLFVQMRGVTWVERKKHEKSEKKRAAKGLRPSPTFHTIVLDGEMKRYSENLKAAASGEGKLRARHAVIKHPRLLMSDRYKKSGLQGETIWVDSHERGGGRIKQQRDYEVKK